MTSTIWTNIGHTRFAIFSNSRDFSQDRRNQFVGFFLTTRHDGWALQSALFTTGHAGTNEVKAFSRQVTVTTNGVVVEGVTTINNDVAFIQVRLQGVDGSIGACARFHH